MKKNYLNLMWLAVAAIFFVSCSDDNDPVIPKLSITADVVEISETATSALVVKVNADATVETAYNVGISLSGTALEGVNFQDISKTITIPADASSANIFVTPINVSAIEDSKTVTIELKAGTAYELTASTNVAITIVDNANPPSDAPEVSFATSNIVTNPYLEEVKTITVGLSKTFASDLTIPLTITGDLVADTDYEIAGLTNDAITIPAGAVSADFTVTLMNTAVVDMDKTLEFAFATPSVTDYAVKATENTVAVNAVDPQVDFSSWFNEENEYNYFFDKWDADGRTYRTDLPAYNPKRYYWDVAEVEWKIFSGDHYFDVNVDDNNQWKEVTNIWHKDLGGTGIDIVEQERYEMHGGDFFGLTKFFDNEATYAKTMIASENGWFRFVTTDGTATEGTVVIPAQTITLYKIKEGYDWKEKTTVDVEGGTESYYAWYADSETTQGDLSQSTNVTPVSIDVAKSLGTYNSSTKEIIFEVTFTCDDADFSIDPKYYIANDGNSYTLKIKYIPTK
ncbi:hypothetical protein L3049_02870 [Labilibaculum sp. DW002]|uniref:Calx-beta domain-containing protein n=1 Tax=Paralabilibaculum antarcticum TaxID=2912572 RepID=A0ABT5VNC0_9BACT|nr:hypothetical protein [Labilibaculum sp. DW002]MDE5416936.1 hypothetical protein [Labilibaculum sp. DW002]